MAGLVTAKLPIPLVIQALIIQRKNTPKGTYLQVIRAATKQNQTRSGNSKTVTTLIPLNLFLL